MCEHNIEKHTQTEPSDVWYTKPIERFDMNSKDTIFAGILVVGSVILSALGIFGGFRAGFTIAAVILLTAITAYLKTKEIKIDVYGAVCCIISLGLSLNFSLTSNAAVRFWSFVLLALLQLIWFTSLISRDRATGDLGILKEIFSPVFRLALPNLPNAVTSLLTSRKNQTLSKILLGILPAIPILVVVIPLLMSSDAAFRGMVSLIFENMALFIVEVILGLIISVFLIAYCFSLKKKALPPIKSSGFKGLEDTAIFSFLAVLSICYLSYLFSQLAYFFSAFRGFLPPDYEFSISEYARRGFFEMTVIAAINFAIIFAILLLSRKKNEKIHVVSRAFCTFIGVFTLIIIATALSKMIFYIKSFGMTELRITTSAFMIFLAVVFIVLIVRLYVPSIKVIKTGCIVAGIILIMLGCVNVNNVIANYNYTAYKNGVLEDIDTSTLYKLGDEGVLYLAKLMNDKDATVAHFARRYLSCAYEEYYEMEYDYDDTVVGIGEKKYKGIGKFSFSRSRAYNVLNKIFEKTPKIVEYKNE